ncbi:hypothetical protein HZH66_012435 [Vespula vulgaris]|uniref:Uncharacterized protein n=1 Tax=Vespula vulgaris TaxID=7454 RepID=A0A834MTR0_VESVU|nr:hypothetical protein HZH66_012435 [Vespula vulgaris]
MPGVADDVVKRTTLCHRECPADALVWLEALLKLDVETRSKVKIVGLKNKSPVLLTADGSNDDGIPFLNFQSLKPTTTTTPYRRQVNDGLKLSLVGGHDRTTLRRLLKKERKKGEKEKSTRRVQRSCLSLGEHARVAFTGNNSAASHKMP